MHAQTCLAAYSGEEEEEGQGDESKEKRNNNNKKAGNPIITLKLKGGITSIATLNKDQTELQTKTNNTKRITGTIFCDKREFISKPTL